MLSRPGTPIFEFRVFLDCLGAQEGYCGKVLQGLSLYPGGNQALARVVENNEILLIQRDRPKVSCFTIADRFEFTGLEFEAENIGNTRVIGAAEQEAAVRREHKAFRNSQPEVELVNGRNIAGKEVIDPVDVQGLIALDIPERPREKRAVG